MQTDTDTRETAPPGFEHVVKGLKGKPGVDNPFAVAWAMKGKGIEPTVGGKECDAEALFKRYQYECGRESNGAGALGALMRSGVKPVAEARRARESERHSAVNRETRKSLACFTPLREASFTTPAEGQPSACRVILITEGQGNLADRNLYGSDALRRSVDVFKGRKCFLNHPSTEDEETRPERDVRELGGWFGDPALGDSNGRTAILATLNFSANDAGAEARALIESALRYQQQFPTADDVFCGFSINASGPSHEELIQGEAWNVVEAIQSVFSVDLVTFPARGGKALAFREAAAVVDRYCFRQSVDHALKVARWRGKIRQAIAARRPEAAHAA